MHTPRAYRIVNLVEVIIDSDDDKIFAVMEYAPGGAIMDDLDGEHLRSTTPDGLQLGVRFNGSPSSGGKSNDVQPSPVPPRTARKYEGGDQQPLPDHFASPVKRMRLPLPEVRRSPHKHPFVFVCSCDRRLRS